MPASGSEFASILQSIATVGIVVILYRREFRSNVVAISGPDGEPIPGSIADFEIRGNPEDALASKK